MNFFPADHFAFPVTTTGPVTQEQGSPLEKLRGRATHIYAGLFFHLFDEPMQKDVAKRLAALISRKPGSILFGSHAGNEQAGPYSRPTARLFFLFLALALRIECILTSSQSTLRTLSIELGCIVEKHIRRIRRGGIR